MTPRGYIWDLDRTLLLWLNGGWGAGWDSFWWAVSQPWFWGALYAVTIWMLYRSLGVKGMFISLGLIIAGLALADQTANFFKSHTPKFRPSRTEMLWEGVPYREWVHTVKNAFTGRGYIGGQFGTVSGHAATSMAIALTAGGILRSRRKTAGGADHPLSRGVRLVSWLLGAYVVLTCFSRMYLGVHFPLDILFGLTSGTLIGLLMLGLWRRLSRTGAVPQRGRARQSSKKTARGH